MNRYCPPVAGRWCPENGVCLRFDPGAPDGALRDNGCRMHGIPCTSIFADEPEAVPVEVAELVDRALSLAHAPHRAAPLWAEAERLLAEAEARRRFVPTVFATAAE